MITDRYTIEAFSDDPADHGGTTWPYTPRAEDAIEVTALDVSVDSDRSPFVTITLTCPPMTNALYAKLDPRLSRRLIWRAKRFNADTERLWEVLPYAGAPGSAVFVNVGYGTAVVRKRTRNLLTGKVTIIATSYEAMMDDKRRNSVTTIDTGATTLRALVDYAKNSVDDSSPDVNGVTDVTSPAASTVAIPAGDRRLWLQGETLAALYESELGATGRRLWDTIEGNQLTIGYADTPVLASGQASTLTLTDAPGGQIIEATEDTDRTNWADAVLVKSSYVNAAGTQVTAYQASGSGPNTRCNVINIGRAAPSAGYADAVLAREQQRALTYTLECAAELSAHPGQTVTLDLTGLFAPVSATIQSVRWQLPEGRMTVVARSAGVIVAEWGGGASV